MANNSKVVFGNETLIDLTGDTAEPGDVLLGKSFHRNSGAPATGTLDPVKKPDVAVIEPSSTASAPHLKDTYLYYDGTLYKATDDIAQGDTIITSGASANVEEVTVGGELNTLNNSLAKQIVRTGVTASANGTVRIPASGTDSRIATTSVVMPICDDNSGKPVKYTSCVVSAGYVTITMAEAISNKNIGVIVINQ